MATRTQRIYGHRRVRLIRDTGDPSLATRLGVPRSTAAGWVRRARRPVISSPGLDGAPPHLLARLTHLEQRVRRLSALLRVLLAVFHVVRAPTSSACASRANTRPGSCAPSIVPATS